MTMKREKIFCVGILVTVLFCIFGAGCNKKQSVGPGTDMEAITEHLSLYSNDCEEHVKIEDLAVIYDNPDFVNLEPWYAFVKKVNAGEAAYVDMVDYTTEGDSIFYYVHFDGKEFFVVQDSTRDSYGTPVILQEKYTYLQEFIEETEDGNQIYDVVLSNIELTSSEHWSEVFWQVCAEMEAGEYDPDAVEYERVPCWLFRAELK